jgi:hypothetical protein
MTEAEKHARLHQLDAIVSDLRRIRHMIERDGGCLDIVRAAQMLERGLRHFDTAVVAAYLSEVLGEDCPGRRKTLPVEGLCKVFERSRQLASSPEHVAL